MCTLFRSICSAITLLALIIQANSSLLESSTYIVGGHRAVQGEVPYQLGLFFNGSHACGASLVEVDGLQIAICAAHCTMEPPSGYTLIAGDLNLNDNSGYEQIRQVVQIINHPNHSPVAHPFDISLLFLNSSFELNQNVGTIALPVQGQITAEGNVKVSGWGKLSYNGNFSEHLQVVSIPMVNDTACQAAYENYFFHPEDSMLCAGDLTGNLYPCQGDSGGPAKSDAGYLAGIVSWGYQCGHPNYPAVFTKVPHYVNWIHSAVFNYKREL